MMDRAFKALKVTDSVYWVGALDWSIRDFHGYATNKGTTYNAFLVMGDEVALIDTVKAPFKDEMLSRIASVIDPERIDYIISNHAELDHAGCLKATARTVKPKKILASKRGIETLMAHHHEDLGVEAVKPGETLSLGNLTLSFIETPMLHWPESMFTFLEEEKVLFSQDAFGMHLATTELFVDQVDKGVIEYEAAKYYANILLPFSGQVKKLMEKVGEMDLGVRVIAPDHGPLWRNHVSGILDYYYKWSQLAFRNKAVVVYDTMWQSTAKMARALSEGLVAGGTQVRILPIRETHRSDIATELLDAGGFFVGSPTLNNNMFPTVADVLTYLRGLKPAGRIGAAFGSFGWSGEGVKQVTEELSKMKMELLDDGISVKYVPNQEVLDRCYALGQAGAKRLEEKWGGSLERTFVG